jgi:hypothetical protein
VSCERAKGCTVTGDASCEKTLIDAGALWTNDTLCMDNALCTAQSGQADNPVFTQFAEVFAPQTDYQQAA